VKALRAAALLVLGAAGSVGAAVTISADLNRDQLALGDEAVLSVTINGDQASLPTPKLPAVDAFSIYDSGRSQNLSWVNGRMSASVVYTYVLKPRAAGRFVIPPISADGVASPSAPINVEVLATRPAPPAPTSASAAGAEPAPPAAPVRGRSRAPDVVLLASLDHPKVFVNQQATLTVRFMNSVQLLGDPRYEAPALTGFLTEDLPPVRTGMTVYQGRQYQVSEIKLALFPVQAGKLKIGPATVRAQVARMAGGSGQDFFDRFFAMAAPAPVTVNSEPLTVTAEALPGGRPEDFAGIVGKLTLSVAADRTSLKAGEAVTFTATVSGVGDIKSVPEPKRPDVPALRYFATESTTAVDKAGDRVGGTKTFRTVAVPRASGEIIVPAFTLSYFDPATAGYLRAASSPITLHVAPGAALGPAAAAGGDPSSPAAGLTVIGDDIRYLKVEPSASSASRGLGAVAGLGAAHAAPFVLFLAAAAFAALRRAREADPRGRRARDAYAKAAARLREAEAAAQADARAKAEALVGGALAEFFADKLGRPAAGLTWREAEGAVKSWPRAPSSSTLERLRALWEEADVRRFAPGAAGGDAESFAREAASALKAFDEETRK
jgi:hypothetical protein